MLSSVIRQEKEIKGAKIRQNKVKLSLFAHGTSAWKILSNLQDDTTISKFSKVSVFY
jgi:hypothetical protein